MDSEYLTFQDEAALDEYLTRPTQRLLRFFEANPGDLLVAGAGGKIGYHVARTAQRCLRSVGSDATVIGVSRFGSPGPRKKLESEGIATIACDLTDQASVARLPDAKNIVFMAGRKFGTAGAAEETWTANAVAPVFVCERYPTSTIVAFSTGCVYDLATPLSGGSREDDPLEGVGEYAQSAVARERVFTSYSRKNGTPVCLFRLNYAIDLRYGVLHDIAKSVFEGRPVSLRTALVNVIWQGDAVERALLSLGLADSPPVPINVTGPETVSVRALAERFGKIFGRQPVFDGEAGGSCYLSDASLSQKHFGYPSVSLLTMVEWTADWIRAGKESWAKPTHFEQAGGDY